MCSPASASTTRRTPRRSSATFRASAARAGSARTSPEGALLLVDEASMMSTEDMADITAFAAANGHKVLLAGDQEQLAAVEGGGGMMLLAGRLGYVQLGEAVRFREQWERDASLGLRRGETEALEEYDRHGRITGTQPDLALDQARAAYLGSYLAGRDVLMIARAHETCRELSRRVRDDLVHLGLVDDTRTAALRDGARAGAGDIIVARRNDHRPRHRRAGTHAGQWRRDARPRGQRRRVPECVPPHRPGPGHRAGPLVRQHVPVRRHRER